MRDLPRLIHDARVPALVHALLCVPSRGSSSSSFSSSTSLRARAASRSRSPRRLALTASSPRLPPAVVRLRAVHTSHAESVQTRVPDVPQRGVGGGPAAEPRADPRRERVQSRARGLARVREGEEARGDAAAVERDASARDETRHNRAGCRSSRSRGTEDDVPARARAGDGGRDGAVDATVDATERAGGGADDDDERRGGEEDAVGREGGGGGGGRRKRRRKRRRRGREDDARSEGARGRGRRGGGG